MSRGGGGMLTLMDAALDGGDATPSGMGGVGYREDSERTGEQVTGTGGVLTLRDAMRAARGAGGGLDTGGRGGSVGTTGDGTTSNGSAN